MNVIQRIIFLILLHLMTGCATQPIGLKKLHELKESEVSSINCESYENHIISIDKRGNHIPITFKSIPGSNKCEFKFEESQSNNPRDLADAQIAKVLNALKNSNKDPFIFIHGGLNNYNVSLGRVLKDTKNIINDGQYFPIFVIWPSGIETYGDSLKSYFQGEWDRSLDSSMFPFKLATDAMVIPARLMANYATSFRLTVNSYCLSENTRDSWLPIPCRNIDRENTKDFYLTNDPCEKDAEEIPGFHCIKEREEDAYPAFDFRDAITLPAKLLTVPIADPITKRGWNSMNARIRFAFRTPCPGDTFTKGDCEPGFVYQFFKAYQKELNKTDKGITVFGHSMGAILAGEIIREFSDLNYEHVIFGGAAISLREFKNTVEAVLKEKEKKSSEYSEVIRELESLKNDIPASEKLDGTIAYFKLLKERHKPFKFFNLSLHPFADSTEDNVKGLMPNGSLLEWIDLQIENPADVLDRTLGKWANITPVLVKQKDSEDHSDEYFNYDLLKHNYMHFSRFGLNKGQPWRHGHFGDSGCFKYWKSDNWILDLGIEKPTERIGNCNAE